MDVLFFWGVIADKDILYLDNHQVTFRYMLWLNELHLRNFGSKASKISECSGLLYLFH